MRLFSVLLLLVASPAAAQEVDIAKLCAEIADPGYTPIVGTGNGSWNLPAGLKGEQRRNFKAYLVAKTLLLTELRAIQLDREAEAQLNLLELALKDEELPPALNQVREKLREDPKTREDEAKDLATRMKEVYNEICPDQAAPNIVLQPIPGLLWPGVALAGAVGAPLPPTASLGPETATGPTELLLEVGGIKENLKLQWADGKYSITDATRDGIPIHDPKAAQFTMTAPKITQSVECKVTLNAPLPAPWTLWLGVAPGDKKIGVLKGPSSTACSLTRGPNPRGPGWAAGEDVEAYLCRGQTFCSDDPVAVIGINWQLP